MQLLSLAQSTNSAKCLFPLAKLIIHTKPLTQVTMKCPVLPSMIPTRYIPIINLFNVLELQGKEGAKLQKELIFRTTFLQEKICWLQDQAPLLQWDSLPGASSAHS